MPRPSIPLPKSEYVTYDEVAVYLGVSRVTVYQRSVALGVPIYKFLRDKRAFLAYEDACKLKQIQEKPWLTSTLFPPSS